jgi:hypothetical protein
MRDGHPGTDGQHARNRRVAAILLFIVGGLALATLVAGIRW